MSFLQRNGNLQASLYTIYLVFCLLFVGIFDDFGNLWQKLIILSRLTNILFEKYFNSKISFLIEII